MKNTISQEQYITQIIDRLKNNNYNIKYHIKDKIHNESLDFVCLAKKTEFEFIRFGFVSTVFIISRHASPEISDLERYSSVCYKIARKSNRIHPPRGFMYGFLCFPVVITEKLNEKTTTFIRHLDMPKHWAASERLVVINMSDSKLYYSEKRPFWGSLYHDLDISIINYFLGFNF